MSRKTEETDPGLVTPGIEALADAVRGDVGAAGVERALAAFREAGSAGAGAAWFRRRRRDDWRPVRHTFPTRVSLRAALGVVLAGVTLGGVALAAGTGALPDPLAPGGTPEPRTGVRPPHHSGSTDAEPDRTPASPTPTPSGSESASSHDPAPGSRVALCHAWAKGNGKHLGTAFQRLAEAAGGNDAVDAYCAALSGADGIAPSAPGKPAETPATGPSKEQPLASPSRGRSAEHTSGAGQRP